MLIPSRSIRQMLAFFLELNSKRLFQSLGKEKESCCLVLTSSAKHEIGYYHVKVVQWRQRNVQKACCTCRVVFFAKRSLLLFCHSRLCYGRCCLTLEVPIVTNINFLLTISIDCQVQHLWEIIKIWSQREKSLILYQFLPTNSVRKCIEISLENLYVDIGA